MSERINISAEILAKVRPKYIQCMLERREQVESAFKSGDWKSALHALHQIRGASGTFGNSDIEQRSTVLHDRIINEKLSETCYSDWELLKEMITKEVYS